MMETLGKMAAAMLVQHHQPTASPLHSVKCRPVDKPTTMAECTALMEWAETTQSRPASVGETAFGKSFEYISWMPKKNADEMSAKKQATVYFALLGGYSAGAISYMVRRAAETLDWFPTPKQCLELVATYRAPVTEQEQALLMCREFAEASFDQWMQNLVDGQPIGDVPERWKRIAVERGTLRLLSDGRFVSRALYHGPGKVVGMQMERAA